MSTIALTTANVSVIGKGNRYAAEMAVAVIAHVGTEYNWTVRGAVPAAIRSALGVTADTEPKQKIGPAGDQRTTDYGRGFDSLASAVRSALKADDDQKVTDWLALVRQAATNAQNKGEFTPEQILSAVSTVLTEQAVQAA
jgi:hypothetical protein